MPPRCCACAGSSFRLVCAGSGVTRDNPELVRSLEAAGVSDLVEVLGPSDDIPALIAGSRALVLSSAYGEAMPMAGLETIAAGRPVVTTDVGGCPSLVVDPAFVVAAGATPSCSPMRSRTC